MFRSYPVYPLGLDQVMECALAHRATHEFPMADLCFGSSAYDPSRFLEIESMVTDLKALLPYGDPAGELELRTAIAAMLSENTRTDISPRRVFVTDGASAALIAALITTVEPGEDVILPEIYYPSYPTMVHLVGASCSFAALDGAYNMTAASARQRMTGRTAAIVINSPGNPFGNVLSRDQYAEFAELGVPIIADEVYTHLCADERTPSLLDVSQDHFVAGSFSKTYAAGGLRLGYLVVPERYIDTMFAVRVTLNVCPSLPSQRLGRALLKHHRELVVEHRQYLEQHRAFFRRCAELNRLRLAVPPDNGIFGLVDVSEYARTRGSLDLALDLARRVNVTTAPGSDFSVKDGHFLRLNYATDFATIETGMARLRAFLDNADISR